MSPNIPCVEGLWVPAGLSVRIGWLIGNGVGGSCSPQLVRLNASGSSLVKAVREAGGLLAKAGNAVMVLFLCDQRPPETSKPLPLVGRRERTLLGDARG
jgi:hypothetical protein